MDNKMQIGRNIEQDGSTYAIAFRFPNETTIRRWNFDTHRKAARKFNELKKTADWNWLPINEDVTI